jgi:hypothetical protein
VGSHDQDEEGMRLPGTRYQEHGWEQVRKLLGQCSLHALARTDLALLADPEALAGMLGEYVDGVAGALRASGRSARAGADGNSYGDSVCELALALVYELQARPADWNAFCAAVAAEYRRLGAFWLAAGGEAILRKKVNDMYAVLRDKVDADNYIAACGRACSPNKIYTYRMLDTAYGEIARIFGAWRENAAQIGAILGRPLDAVPIEVRQMKSVGACKAEWILRWSETLERFGGAPGPLHTRSKRFASLKNSPEKIQAMLAEIGDYEELSANRDHDWLLDAGEAADWLDDYQRVLNESAEAASDGPDQLQDAADDDSGPAEPPPDAASEDAEDPAAIEIAAGLSLPPRFMQLARAAQDNGSWTVRTLAADSLPVRLAVYLKMMGAADDSYPGEWLDPATGELPTMQQLAALDQVSLPTLRKRRDAAIAALLAAARP